MNVNFGLMPPSAGKARKADRKKAYTQRARTAFSNWLKPGLDSETADLVEAEAVANS
jgi:methylenetetrahydrofolate--tRNA-(uracil-5-)-methyltransferase